MSFGLKGGPRVHCVQRSCNHQAWISTAGTYTDWQTCLDRFLRGLSSHSLTHLIHNWAAVSSFLPHSAPVSTTDSKAFLWPPCWNESNTCWKKATEISLKLLLIFTTGLSLLMQTVDSHWHTRLPQKILFSNYGKKIWHGSVHQSFNPCFHVQNS